MGEFLGDIIKGKVREVFRVSGRFCFPARAGNDRLRLLLIHDLIFSIVLLTMDFIKNSKGDPKTYLSGTGASGRSRSAAAAVAAAGRATAVV